MAERPIHKNTHQSEIKSEIKAFAFPYVVYLLQSRRGKTRGCPGAGWGRGRSIGSPSPPGRPSTSHQPWYSWIRLPLPLCKKKKRRKRQQRPQSSLRFLSFPQMTFILLHCHPSGPAASIVITVCSTKVEHSYT